MQAEELFYVIDLRPEWTVNPCITLWRPNDSGYAYPRAWAGKYTRKQIDEGGEHYATKGGGRYYQRFAVTCETVEQMAAPLSEKIVDCWKEGPHILNSGKARVALRRARYQPAADLTNAPLA
ncbi:hypothetical protein [Methylobacterium flocculans]|uniref:hypothetical protein n=1 Tax=Methylobacterium flocculans TaxID=2984843 RepID=UPI0021F3C7DB|nr:hypothetical protein [Methylobacterium sp. FF17]